MAAILFAFAIENPVPTAVLACLSTCVVALIINWLSRVLLVAWDFLTSP